MYRRQALAVGASLLTAGCAGVAGFGRQEPAAFEVSLSTPSTVDLGAEFEARVTVTNTGGSRGRYRGTLTAFPDMRHDVSVPVDVGPIRPGETVEETVGPLVAPYAGRWAFALEGVDRSLDVRPLGPSLGTPIQLAGNLELVVSTVTRHDAYDYVDPDEGRTTRTAPEGRTFYVATVTVGTVGVDRMSAPSRAEFSAVVGGGNYPIHLARERWEWLLLPGDPYPAAADLGPRESITGWIPFETPDDDLLAVAWNRDLRTSPPEALWRNDEDTAAL